MSKEEKHVEEFREVENMPLELVRRGLKKIPKKKDKKEEHIKVQIIFGLRVHI